MAKRLITCEILNGIPTFKNGSGIHIKEKNKGTFTKYCNGKVTQACIDKAKRSGNKKLIKRAVFAENSRKWTKKHQIGGVLQWLKDQFIKFGNAQIAGDSGAGTAMAIASGYEHNPKTGKWEQSEERVNDPAVKALRNNLSVISGFSPSINPVVKQAANKAVPVVKEVVSDFVKVGKPTYQKIGSELLKGAAGAAAVDAFSQAVTGRTWGNNVRYVLPEVKWVPEWVKSTAATFTNPGGFMGTSKVFMNELNQLPRKTFHFLGQFDFATPTQFVKDVFKSDITKNPIKSALFKKLLRDKRYSPKVRTETYNYTGPANSQDDALELLKQRYTSGGKERIDARNGSFTLDTPLETFNDVKVTDHLNMSTIYKNLTRDHNSVKSALVTPYIWAKYNMLPGAANSRWNTIIYNPGALKRVKSNINSVLAHEYNHVLDPNVPAVPKGILKYNHLPKRYKNYLTDPSEVSARGTQIKNYFGFNRDDQQLTTDMLKYAADNYVKDTGMDNNMTQFFSGVKDWDSLTDWINKNSLKQGGKLC